MHHLGEMQAVRLLLERLRTALANRSGLCRVLLRRIQSNPVAVDRKRVPPHCLARVLRRALADRVTHPPRAAGAPHVSPGEHAIRDHYGLGGVRGFERRFGLRHLWLRHASTRAAFSAPRGGDCRVWQSAVTVRQLSHASRPRPRGAERAGVRVRLFDLQHSAVLHVVPRLQPEHDRLAVHRRRLRGLSDQRRADGSRAPSAVSAQGSLAAV